MRLTRFGTVDLPQANAQDSIPANMRGSLIQLPNGSFDQDGDRVYLETARITRRMEVNGGEEIDGVINALNKQLIKGRNVLRALWRDNVTELVTWAKIGGITRQIDVDDYDCRTPMTLNFEQDYPYWLHGEDGWFFDTGETFDSGLFFDGDYRHFIINTALPYSFTVLNGGNAAVPAMTWTIVPRSGSSITNPKITNLSNQMSFQYDGVVNASERLVVDTLPQTAELDGTSIYEDFELSGERQVDWMKLEPDTNSFRLSGTIAGAVDMYLVFSRHFV